jgi:hypothetical protein
MAHPARGRPRRHRGDGQGRVGEVIPSRLLATRNPQNPRKGDDPCRVARPTTEAAAPREPPPGHGGSPRRIPV